MSGLIVSIATVVLMSLCSLSVADYTIFGFRDGSHYRTIYYEQCGGVPATVITTSYPDDTNMDCSAINSIPLMVSVCGRSPTPGCDYFECYPSGRNYAVVVADSQTYIWPWPCFTNYDKVKFYASASGTMAYCAC